jgi:hypothetical protein
MNPFQIISAALQQRMDKCNGTTQREAGKKEQTHK